MARDAREVIIRIDLDNRYVEVWCEDRGWQARLVRAGFTEKDRQGRGAWYRGQPKQIRLVALDSIKGRRTSEASLAALEAARLRRRVARLAAETAGLAGGQGEGAA